MFKDSEIIIPEIIYNGISDEHSVLHFGAGYSDGDFIRVLESFEFTVNYTGVESDKEKIKKIKKELGSNKKSYSNSIVHSSMQEFIDSQESEFYDWTVITGVFNDIEYGEQQYEFIFNTVEICKQFSSAGVIFTLKEKPNENFTYSMIYILARLFSTYNNVTVKKIVNGNYIFSVTY